jgi:hypothetical protein
MRHSLVCEWLLVGLTVVFLVASCGRDPAAPVIEGTGEFSGTWDGTRWLGRGYAVIDGETLFLVGHRPDPRYYYDEFVRVELEHRGNGTYSVPESGSARLEKVTGGDAGYFPDASGTLTISSNSEKVSGFVELQALGPDGKLWRFKRGRFSVPVYHGFTDSPNLHGARGQ